MSDSSLALISGGKRNRRRADLQDMNYNRSSGCSHCEVKMCWGKDLTFLAWTVKSTMKSEFKDHDFYVTVYWSGNELVGSGGICDKPEWPILRPLARAVQQVRQGDRCA